MPGDVTHIGVKSASGQTPRGIGWAVEKMKRGFVVRRAGWVDKDYVGIMILKSEHDGGELAKTVVSIYIDERLRIWQCDPRDLLATDWIVSDELD